jgi:hypothetical protein
MTKILSATNVAPEDEPSLLALSVNQDGIVNRRNPRATTNSYQNGGAATSSSSSSHAEPASRISSPRPAPAPVLFNPQEDAAIPAEELERKSPESSGSLGNGPSEVEMRPLRPDHDYEAFGDQPDDTLAAGVHMMKPTGSSFLDWMYPPAQPYELQLFRLVNIAIPCCYLLVGILQGLSSVWLNVYPLDLGATEAQQVTLSTLRSLPASFKLVFGFISDTLPLCSFRRKSYMLIGWSIASVSMMILLAFSNVRLDASEDERPSIEFLSLMTLLFGLGFWWADVMADSVVAEKAKLEPVDQRGHLQSTCYACRFFGLMCAAPFGTWLYQSGDGGPHVIVTLMVLFPLGILPLVYFLREHKQDQVTPVSEQCKEIFNTVCSRAVWQPMGFVFLYNLLQIGNAAWRQFLMTGLDFDSAKLNTLLMVSYVLLYLGVMCYKYYLIHWSWRSVYILTTGLNGVASLLQILLIEGMTLGLSPFLFALGDDAFAEFIGGIQFLPTTIMMVHLCPTGSEGASYAMFTTVNNSALTLSAAISTLLLPIWDVSKEAFEAGDYSGMINLTLLTTFLQVSGICFVCWLPRTKEDLVQLGEDSPRSFVGGIIFLVITFSSILYAIIIGVHNVVSGGAS